MSTGESVGPDRVDKGKTYLIIDSRGVGQTAAFAEAFNKEVKENYTKLVMFAEIALRAERAEHFYEATDLVQVSLLRAWKTFHMFDPKVTTFTAWMEHIIERRARAYERGVRGLYSELIRSALAEACEHVPILYQKATRLHFVERRSIVDIAIECKIDIHQALHFIEHGKKALVQDERLRRLWWDIFNNGHYT